MRLIDADKGLISKIQRKTGCNFITAQQIVDSMQTVQAIQLDRVKEAREEIENINPVCSTIGNGIPVLKNCDDIKTEVLEILDRLIEGGEE